MIKAGKTLLAISAVFLLICVVLWTILARNNSDQNFMVFTIQVTFLWFLLQIVSIPFDIALLIKGELKWKLFAGIHLLLVAALLVVVILCWIDLSNTVYN